MRSLFSCLMVLSLAAGCATTGGPRRVLPPDPGREMTLAIPGADSAQIIDALGRRLRCSGTRCRPMPGATYGGLERRAGPYITLGPDIAPPLRLIVWAATRPSLPPPELRVDSLPLRPGWKAAPFPQVELYESGEKRCRKADSPLDGVEPGTRCEWLLDIVPSDSSGNCRITLTLQKLLPPKTNR